MGGPASERVGGAIAALSTTQGARAARLPANRTGDHGRLLAPCEKGNHRAAGKALIPEQALDAYREGVQALQQAIQHADAVISKAGRSSTRNCAFR